MTVQGSVQKKVLLGIALMGGLAATAAQAGDIQLNGFGSVYGGKSFSSDLVDGAFSPTTSGNSGNPDNKFQFAPLSRIGLNVGAQLTDTLQVAAQFVADGSVFQNARTQPNWSLFANWAFVTWTPMPGLDIKGGRQLFPAFLASEYVEVGALQPYRRIPTSVFNLSPFTSFDGLAVNYTYNLGFTRAQAGVFGGRATQNLNSFNTDVAIDSSNILGGQLTFTGDGYKVHGMVARSYGLVDQTVYGTTFFPNGVANSQVFGNVTTVSFGASYDKNDIVLWGEYIFIKSDDGNFIPGVSNGTFLRGSHGGYALAGYRFGKFLPRYMFSITDESELGITLVAGKLQQHDIGVNYQISDSAVFKLDFLVDKVPTGYPPVSATLASGSTSSTATAFTTGVDFLF